MGIIVTACFKPNEGKTDELLEVMSGHLPLVQSKGLATERDSMRMISLDGTVIEIFEWASEEASQKAHVDEDVQKIWGRLGEIAEYVPIGGLEEAVHPFSGFHACD